MTHVRPSIPFFGAIVGQESMIAFGQLALQAPDANLKKLSAEEKKVLKTMMEALHAGDKNCKLRGFSKERLDELKSHLQQRATKKPSGKALQILKGVANILRLRISTAELKNVVSKAGKSVAEKEKRLRWINHELAHTLPEKVVKAKQEMAEVRLSLKEFIQISDAYSALVHDLEKGKSWPGTQDTQRRVAQVKNVSFKRAIGGMQKMPARERLERVRSSLADWSHGVEVARYNIMQAESRKIQAEVQIEELEQEKARLETQVPWKKV